MAEPGIHRIEVTTLGDLLDLRAAEQGERLALVFPDHQVSYAGLAERAGVFARGLIAAGLKPGQGRPVPSPGQRPLQERRAGRPHPSLADEAAVHQPGRSG